MSNIIPYHQPQTPAPSQWRGVIPTDMDSALRMAKAIAASGMAPRAYYENNNDPTACCFVAIQLGGEVGLSPMASVQNIAVINGRPGLYGPAQLAVVEASKLLVNIEERIDGTGDARTAVCTVQRVGRKPRTVTFSVQDARQAGLWDKRSRSGQAGPWQQYPERMLQARARSFALRDVFPDVLLGLAYSAEELSDIPLDDSRSQANGERPQEIDVTPPKPESPPSEPSQPESSPEDAPDTTPAPPAEETPEPPKQTKTFRIEGLDRAFARTKRGMIDAFDALERSDNFAQLVMLNLDLLDRMQDAFSDELSERVSELRARAAQALAPKSESDPAGSEYDDERTAYDAETGEVIERGSDPVTDQMAVRRGAAPRD